MLSVPTEALTEGNEGDVEVDESLLRCQSLVLGFLVPWRIGWFWYEMVAVSLSNWAVQP